MSSTCPTVKVVSPESPDGFVIINESDRKPEHEIWEEPPPPGDGTLKAVIGAPRLKLESDAANNVARPTFNPPSAKKSK